MCAVSACIFAEMVAVRCCHCSDFRENMMEKSLRSAVAARILRSVGDRMANSWNIPAWLEKEVRERDKACVYCAEAFTSLKICRKSAPSWEHIINDAKIITRENIALCCCGCNASKGQKLLIVWLQTKYCEERGINQDTIAPIIKLAIANGL